MTPCNDLIIVLLVPASAGTFCLGLVPAFRGARPLLGALTALLAGGALLLAAARFPLSADGAQVLVASGPLFWTDPRWSLAGLGLVISGMPLWAGTRASRAWWPLVGLTFGAALGALVTLLGTFHLAEASTAGVDAARAGVVAAKAARRVGGYTGHLASLTVLLAVPVAWLRGRSLPGTRPGNVDVLVAVATTLALRPGLVSFGLIAVLLALRTLAATAWVERLLLRGVLRATEPGSARLVLALLIAAAWAGPVLHVFGLATGTGWVRLPGGAGAVLPMTGVFLLLPLLVALRLWGGQVQTPGRDTLMVFAVAAGLILQGETGLVLLTGLAWVAAVGSAEASPRALLWSVGAAGAGVVGAVVALGLAPGLYGHGGELLARAAAVVGGSHDFRQLHVLEGFSLARQGGPLGLGVCQPAGLWVLPAWTNDMLPLITARLLGAPGLAGLGVAVVCPALVALTLAAEEDFDGAASAARPFAVGASAWAVMVGGGALLLFAGATRQLPLTGVTWGFAVPALNHHLVAVPALCALLMRSLHSPDGGQRSGWSLRLGARRLSRLGQLATLVLVSRAAWRFLDTAEVVVLPTEHAATLRLSRGEALPDGEGPLVLQLTADGAVRAQGLRLRDKDLAAGFTVGRAGRFAPPLLPVLIQDRIALSNDLWLESHPEIRWREAVLEGSAATPTVAAATAGGQVRVLDGDTEVCRSEGPERACTLAVGHTLRIGPVDQFRVTATGDALELGWEHGAPAPWPIPPGGTLLLGGRQLSARQVADQVWDRAAAEVVTLLGEAGVLWVLDDTLRVDGPPTVVAGSSPGEQAVRRAAVALFRTWLRPTDDPACLDGWRWRENPTREQAGGCVADATDEDRLVSRSGRVTGLRRPPTRLLGTLSFEGALVDRGDLLDAQGRSLTTWQSDGSRRAWHPSAASLVGWWRGVGGSRYGGLERVFERLLAGSASSGVWAEAGRRARGLPRAPGASVATTLDRGDQEALAASALAGASRLAAARRGRSRGTREGRDCGDYAVDATAMNPGGGILATVTAIARLGPDGRVQAFFDGPDAPQTCLPESPGPVRALTAAEPSGSVMKPPVYGLLATWFPERLVRAGGASWVASPDDPDNATGGLYDDKRGVLTHVAGRNVVDCRNYSRTGALRPLGLLSLERSIAVSSNVHACYSAALIGPELLLSGFRDLGLVAELDLLPGLGDAAFDAALIRRSGDVLTARPARWLHVDDHGRLAPWAATKIGLGLPVRASSLGLAQIGQIIAAGGLRCRPHLVRAVTSSIGSVVPAVDCRRVFTPDAAQLLGRGMRRAVSDLDGTAHAVLGEWPSVIAKTGTADREVRSVGTVRKLASHKTALVIDLSPDHPVVVGVIARHAQGLDDQVALQVAEDFLSARPARSLPLRTP